MKTLRRLLLVSAFLLAVIGCTGCDDDDKNLPFAGGAWVPVPGVFISITSSGSGSSTP